jgi:hypothetical protein
MIMMLRRVVAALDRHWFAPALFSDLALVRILAFGSQTLVFLWYPAGGLRSVSEELLLTTAGAPLYYPLPILRVLLAPFGQLSHTPPSATFLLGVFAVAVVAGVLATIGLFARVAMLAAAAANGLIVAHHYSYQEFHHAEALMAIALGVLALSPSAAVWSVDAAVRRWRTREALAETSVFARWPLRLMQWIMALTYLSAATAKLRYGGLAWFNGHTMTYHYLSIAIETGREAPAYLATFPPALHVAPSMVAWLVEATFWVAILAPRFAWILVVAGAGLHLAVFASMGIAFFQNILLYSVFAESLRLYAPRPFPVLHKGHRGETRRARLMSDGSISPDW